jgi:Protein of unknown function (DUF3995)
MIAIVCSVILAYAAVFHFYWGFGGKIGIEVSLPQLENGQPAFKQTAIGAHLVGLILISFIVIVLSYSSFISLPISSKYLQFCIGFLSLIFITRALSWHRYVGLFKSVRTTKFAHYDTWQYSPLSLMLGLGLAYVCIKP